MKSKVLVISAHADDAELGAGGTIARHVEGGDEVRILLVTHSGYNDYNGKTIRTKKRAANESKKSLEVLGVNQVDCLNYETKKVVYDVRLIEDINRYVDEFTPDIIYTHWDGDANQDHEAIAKATFIGARNYHKILKYRSNWHVSTKEFKENFYVDISNQIDKKMDAIKSHKSEIDKRGGSWQEYFKSKSRLCGIEIGVQYAEVFEIHKWVM